MTPRVIVHYHLRPGGVTRVIEAHSRALTRRGHPHVILAAGSDRGADDLPIRAEPLLDYQPGPGDPHALAAVLLDHARAAFPEVPQESICWHFHNPLLGKNPALTAAIAQLAEAGHAMLLEHHDFAEDGRPVQWARLAHLPALYPVSPRVGHAVVNSRDRDFLVAAGVPAGQVIRLVNPVDPGVGPTRAHDVGTPLVFLPVRAIVRKNLGEVLLHAAHASGAERFAISRAPGAHDHVGLACHDHWRELALECGLPVEFAVSDRIAPPGGTDTSFWAWYAAATHGLSCSLAEGFGYTFFEAPAHGLPVMGRCPQAIADDLPEAIRRSLYHRIEVPAEWLGESGSEAVSWRDFGDLSVAEQSAVIRRAQAEPEVLQVVRDDGGRELLRDYLSAQLANRRPADVDLANFSPDACVDELIEHTDRLVVASFEPPRWLPKDAMRVQFP